MAIVKTMRKKISNVSKLKQTNETTFHMKEQAPTRKRDNS